MHRFYLPPGQCAGESLELTPREAHHAVQVLRLRHGETVQVLDGQGTVLTCEVADCARARVGLRVVERHVTPAPSFHITLLQALPKGKLFEVILQKSTELGVTRVVPLLTERAIPHFDGKDGRAKTERWRQVVVEAIKQCGSPWLPVVDEPQRPQQFLARQERFELAFFGSLQPNARHPRIHFEALARNGGKPSSVAVWVGPEGDFSPDETSLLERCGILPITLGPLVLRTETAAIYCLSFINYELRS